MNPPDHVPTGTDPLISALLGALIVYETASLCAAYRRVSILVPANPESSDGFAIRMMERLLSNDRDRDIDSILAACEAVPESDPHDYATSAYYGGIHALASSLAERGVDERILSLRAARKMLEEVTIAAYDNQRIRSKR